MMNAMEVKTTEEEQRLFEVNLYDLIRVTALWKPNNK